jgi:hypothetical protein
MFSYSSLSGCAWPMQSCGEDGRGRRHIQVTQYSRMLTGTQGTYGTQGTRAFFSQLLTSPLILDVAAWSLTVRFCEGARGINGTQGY